MQMAATTSSAMLKGQVATPLSVSGVTTAPSRMPTRTKHRRASGSGICIGRPASAANATVNIEPETRPPGKPTRVSPTPPSAAISSVSATGTSLLRGGRTRGIEDFPTLGPHDDRRSAGRFRRDQCRAKRTASNPGTPRSRRIGRQSAPAIREMSTPARAYGPPTGGEAVNGPLAGPERTGSSIFSDGIASDRMTPLRPGTRSYAARLDRHRLRARLYRPFVRDRQLWGSDAAVWPPGTFAQFHLSAFTGDLLHVVDVLWVGGAGLTDRLRLPDDLCRADPGDRVLLALDHAHRAPRQDAEHHLDRRFHRRALRQGADRCRRGGADRDHRHDSLHRTPAQGGVVLADHDSCAYWPRERRDAAGPGRHRALRRGGDGDLRRSVWHPSYRRDRASGRVDAGDRNRIDRQARRLRRGRRIRHVLDVRWAAFAFRPSPATAQHCRRAHPRAGFRHAPRDDAAVRVRHRVAAAPVPRNRRRE